MTIQTLGIGKTAYPDLAYGPASERTLDRLDQGNIAKRLIVFTPGGEGVTALIKAASQKIGVMASLDTIHRVVSFNPDNLWAISRRSRYHSGTPRGEGFVAFLMLNERGLAALADGTLNGLDPDQGFLAGQNEKPEAIYVWGLHAEGILAAGVSLVFEKISSPRYCDVPLYARAVTESGRQFLETIGFRPRGRIGNAVIEHLHMFLREGDPRFHPAYDGYRAGADASGPSVSVARSLDDVHKALAIRSAVYIAEQECPYEEEFDGNDFCATHLLGYVGNEPVATLRLRFFADFAKLERVAVRHDFRNTRIAFELVKAAIELVQVKGYRRLYGHARKKLTSFWTRFGFRIFEGGRELAFSDHDYVEMVLEMDRHPEAISLGTDPYVIIRPEGRWHRPGLLERSAARPLTRPSRALARQKSTAA